MKYTDGGSTAKGKVEGKGSSDRIAKYCNGRRRKPEREEVDGMARGGAIMEVQRGEREGFGNLGRRCGKRTGD